MLVLTKDKGTGNEITCVLYILTTQSRWACKNIVKWSARLVVGSYNIMCHVVDTFNI